MLCIKLSEYLWGRVNLGRKSPREWSGNESTPGTFQDGGSLLHLLYSANCPLRDESGKNQLTEIRLAPHVWHFHAAIFVLNFALLSFHRDSFSLARIMRKPAFVCWRLTGQNRTTSCFSTIRCVFIHCSQLFVLNMYSSISRVDIRRSSLARPHMMTTIDKNSIF